MSEGQIYGRSVPYGVQVPFWVAGVQKLCLTHARCFVLCCCGNCAKRRQLILEGLAHARLHELSELSLCARAFRLSSVRCQFWAWRRFVQLGGLAFLLVLLRHMRRCLHTRVRGSENLSFGCFRHVRRESVHRRAHNVRSPCGHQVPE